MSLIQSFIMSLVEGVTEFLPVSSTGHLILVSRVLNIAQSEFIKSFEISIQLGAILAVVGLYWRRIFTDFEGGKKILAAFLPTAGLGFILYKFVKTYLVGNSWVVVAALFIGGILLIVIEKFFKSTSSIKDFSGLNYKQAFLIGLGQALSMVPGVSRAAATIISGMFVGLSRESAAEFSFLLAIPTMAAATGMDLIRTGWSFSIDQYLFLAVGFIGAFISALVTVKLFVKFTQTHSFVSFGIYRIVVAIVFWISFLRT